MKRCTLVVALKNCSAISFQPSKEGMGVQESLQRMIELFLNKSLKVHHPHSLAHLHCPTMVMSQIAEVLINATTSLWTHGIKAQRVH